MGKTITALVLETLAPRRLLRGASVLPELLSASLLLLAAPGQ
jgi:hypothetical protein